MFSGQLPHFLEPRKLADQEAEITGQTTVARLPRLAEFEASQQQVVEVALRFARDEAHRQCLSGTIRTELTMTCQRCLEPVSCQIVAKPALVMVYDEEQMRALPEHLDPWLVEEDRIMLADLAAEELLLALPLVAMHEQCPKSLPNPAGAEGSSEAPKQAAKADNPFAVLAQIKRRHDD